MIHDITCMTCTYMYMYDIYYNIYSTCTYTMHVYISTDHCTCMIMHKYDTFSLYLGK